MIRYHLFPSKFEASVAVASELAQTIIENPKRRMGWATGNTMILIYARLCALLQEAGVSLKDLVSYNLDEWGFEGCKRLSRSDPRSFSAFMEEHLFNELAKLGFDSAKNAHFPSHQISLMLNLSTGMDLSGYDALIQADGGVDTWLAGVGADTSQHPGQAHMAFMERRHLLDLGDDWINQQSYSALLENDTIENNKNYDGCNGDVKRVPNLAMTVGTATMIRQVKRRLIIAGFGVAKAGSLYGACERTPQADCSASIAQLMSDRGIQVDVYMDHAAAAQLRRQERFVAH